MYLQVDRAKENESRAVANDIGQKRSNGKQDFGFVDNRSESKSYILKLNNDEATQLRRNGNVQRVKTQNPQEEKIKNGFEELFESKASVKGSGGQGADIAIKDAYNLWISEAKGKDNPWMSSKNIDKDGNVPSKQLMNRLQGFLKQKISYKSELTNDTVTETIQDYIANAGVEGHGYKNLLLGSTGIDVDDSLIGVETTKNEDDEGGTVSTKQSDFNPLTVNIVLSFIEDALAIKTEKQLGFTKTDYFQIKESWVSFKGNAREWFIEESIKAHELEMLYTKARKMMSQEIRSGKDWDKMEDSDAKEMRLIPVVSIDKYIDNAKKLKDMKVVQEKRNSSISQLYRPVAQLKKFKDSEEAKVWLRANLRIEIPAEGGEYDFFIKYLTGDPTYGNNDIQANVGLLFGVFDEIKQEIETENQTRGLTKQRTLTSTQLIHILKGEVKAGTITGGHCKSGCEGNGFTVTQKSTLADGFYVGELTHKDATAKKTSTFFSDSWSENDIIIAIEYAIKEILTKPIYTIKTPKGTGKFLFDNGDSIFPFTG